MGEEGEDMCKKDSLLEEVKEFDTRGGSHKGDENQLWNDHTGGVTPKESNNPQKTENKE